MLFLGGVQQFGPRNVPKGYVIGHFEGNTGCKG